MTAMNNKMRCITIQLLLQVSIYFACLQIFVDAGFHLCGPKLADTLAFVCRGRGYYWETQSSSRRELEDVSKRANHLLNDVEMLVEKEEFLPKRQGSIFLAKKQASAFLSSRRKRSIVNECCINSCTLQTLERYCAPKPTVATPSTAETSLPVITRLELRDDSGDGDSDHSEDFKDSDSVSKEEKEQDKYSDRESTEDVWTGSADKSLEDEETPEDADVTENSNHTTVVVTTVTASTTLSIDTDDKSINNISTSTAVPVNEKKTAKNSSLRKSAKTKSGSADLPALVRKLKIKLNKMKANKLKYKNKANKDFNFKKYKRLLRLLKKYRITMKDRRIKWYPKHNVIKQRHI